MNKQSCCTFSTTLIGSRSCYITTNKLAFLSVEAILTGTIHISNDILNWFWILFKNINPLTKRKEKRVYWIFKTNIAHFTHKRALRTFIIASAHRFKSLFVQAKFTRTLCIWTIRVSNERNSAIVIPIIRGECATHRNCSQKCHSCKQQKSFFVETFDFAVTQVDNFCENELITVMCKLFDGKDARFVLFKPKR